MRKLFFLFLFAPFFAFGQSDSSSFNQALTASILNDIGENIYNGKQHIGYLSSINGNPYYQADEWQHCSITYHDIFYPDVTLKYDLVQNEVIIRHNKNDIAVALFTPWIQGFSIYGQRFFYSRGNSKLLPPAGIYEEVEKGKINFYIHRSKYIKETINGLVLTRQFDDNDLYYVVKNGICYPVYKPKDIFRLVKEKKAEIKKDLKSKGLGFRVNSEAAFTEIVAYYNKTTR